MDLLILPFNVAVAMPEELDPHSDAVWEALEDYLRAHGKRLRTVSYRDARRFWIASIQEVRAKPAGSRAGFDDAVRVLVGKLARHADFDSVIVPSLIIREARIAEDVAAWDGVERALEIEAISQEARRIADSTPLEGLAPAASLHAVVLDAAGNQVQQSQGGLDLIVGVRVMRRPGSLTGEPAFQFTTRSEPFANRDHLTEGIALALSPFLPSLLPVSE
jgi:hypothetical protein